MGLLAGQTEGPAGQRAVVTAASELHVFRWLVPGSGIRSVWAQQSKCQEFVQPSAVCSAGMAVADRILFLFNLAV